MATPVALMGSSSPSKLGELDLKPGLQIQVEHHRTSQRIRVELIGAVQNTQLLLSCPSGRSFARKGDKLRLRLMSGNWICAFDTSIQELISSPFAAWVVDYPDQIELARLREETRIPLVLKVRIDGAEPLEGPEGIQGLITDIHMQGASLETTVEIGKLGESVFISTLISFAGTEQLVLIPAKIESQSRQTKNIINIYQFGLKFDPLDDETRVFLQGFIAQQTLESLGYQLVREREI